MITAIYQAYSGFNCGTGLINYPKPTLSPEFLFRPSVRTGAPSPRGKVYGSLKRTIPTVGAVQCAARNLPVQGFPNQSHSTFDQHFGRGTAV